MVDGFAKTPRYVLKDGALPTGPTALQSVSNTQTTIIFGFSDKPEYDIFLKASSLSMTPYPIVKGFLQNQIALEVDSLKLIVLDAASPSQPQLHAATMQSVLESFQLDSDSVAISHQLILDQSLQEYRVQTFADAASARLAP